MEFTQEQFDEKFNSLPKELQDAISSVEIGTLVAKIGDDEGLMLDQSADLMDQVGYVMLGLMPTDIFVHIIARRLKIDAKKASMIATKINDQVFNKIRSSLEQIQEKEKLEEEVQEESSFSKSITPDVSITIPSAPVAASVPTTNNTSIEKVAGISIEKRAPSASPLYDSSTLKREDVLRDLEDIEKLKPQNASGFVNHLLSNPVSPKEEVEVKKPAPVIPAKPAPQPPRTGTDPYREQF